MPSLALARGQRVWMDDAMHEVRGSAIGDILHLERTLDGDMRRVTHRELAELICADKAKLVAVEGTGREAKIVAENLEKDLAALPEPIRHELDRRRAYLKAIQEGHVLTLTERSLSGLIRQIGEAIGDAKPPHWTTLYRWATRLSKASGDIRALIPAYDRRGNRTRRFEADVIKLIDQGIKERFLQRERPPARAAHAFVIREIDDRNHINKPEHTMKFPSLRSIYRAIRRLDDYEVTKERYGQRIADLKYQVAGQAPKPTRPLERVEMDHTKLDLMVVDDECGVAMGRPWLTLAMDVHTRMPVGFHLGFTDPSFDTVMSCLQHAIRPKTYVAERYPDIKHGWDCYGVPETVVVDNGREFHSKSFELACLQLGIQIQHAPRKSPWIKGTVERHFGKVNQGLLHSQPGTTFSNIRDRADYDPKKTATITFSLLVEMIHQWIIDDFARSHHRGLNDLPGDMWLQSVQDWPVRLPSKASDLDVILWRTVENKPVHPEGIILDSLKYNSERLGELRRIHAGTIKTTVKVDPDDLGHILVLDPMQATFFEVPAIAQDYAKGLTLWQHRVITEETRRSIQGRIDAVHLARTRESLWEKARQLLRSSKGTGRKAKAARYAGIDSREQTQPIDRPSAQSTPQPPPSAPPSTTFDDDDWGGGYDMPPRC